MGVTAQAAYVAPPVELPTTVNCNRRLHFSSGASATVAFPVVGEDGVPVLGELISLPVGTNEIYFQNRMCGDFYCFIGGERQVSATGETIADAFGLALKAARA